MTEEAEKIKFEYENPDNVEAEVPTLQNLREVDKEQNIDGAVSNIEEIQNGGSYRIVKQSYIETRSEVVQDGEVTKTTVKLSSDDGKEVKEVTTEDRRSRTKIPKLKFRQTVEKVRAEQKKAKSDDIESPKSKINRRSKIPPPSSKPIVTKRNSALMDDEFEKIYEDLIDEQMDFDENIIGNKIDDPEKVEKTFEEIIHDYDENRVQPINVETIRHSKIPSRRRKSEQDRNFSEEDTQESKSSKLLLRNKSIHDDEIPKALKPMEETKYKSKFTSSIPLPRRKSGQDGELSKTTYSKTEKDGVVTETIRTITKSAPVKDIVIQKGTSTYETNVTNKNVSDHNENIEDSIESKTIAEQTKITKSIPRLINIKNDGRKILRTFTRTVTTEKVTREKDEKSGEVNINENTTPSTTASQDNTDLKIEATSHQENSKKVNTLQEENIVKDSIRIGIPSFESEVSGREENIQTVEVTKILEWDAKADDKIEKNNANIKLKIKHESNDTINMKLDDKNSNQDKLLNNSKTDTQILRNSEEDASFKSVTNKVSTTTSHETQIVPESVIVNETNIKIRDGSRFNKVSNLNILKGIEQDDELLKSPKLLNDKTESPVDKNHSVMEAKETKVFEVLESPKIDKDGNIDLLPEYKIKIKRLSGEMKENESLKEWNNDQKEKEDTVIVTKLTETIATQNKPVITNMDNARNLLSRVLDRERKIDGKYKEETKLELTGTREVNKKISSSKTNTTGRKSVSTEDIGANNAELNKCVIERTGNISRDLLKHSKIENNGQVEVVQISENIGDLEIKGKVGKLITKIDGKEFSNDSIKKIDELPGRRSVLSKVAMFERQEPLEVIKARISRVETKPPKLIIKDEPSPTHVYVHTPKIVEEVLKSADWDLNLNKNEENIDTTWKIDFDKIITKKTNVNIDNFKDKSGKEVMHEVTRDKSVIKEKNSFMDVQSKPNDLKSDDKINTSDMATIKETVVNEQILPPSKPDFKVQITDDYKAVNLGNVAETVVMRDKLKVDQPSMRDVATSPTRLSLNSIDLENMVKNQVLTNAPVIIVHPKINDNMSKSTEAIFSIQPNIDPKAKKVDRTTSMTDKLYPEKVKANIALYESIRNDSYYKVNKSDRKRYERATSAIYETYKNERYAKANKISIPTTYTPQNSFSSDFTPLDITENRVKHAYESSISIDETKLRANKEKYGSLHFLNESIDESINKKSESITEMNKSVYRLTFDDSKSDFDNDSKIYDNIKSINDVEIKPINEIVDSYEIYSKTAIDNVSNHKYKLKYDDEETGEHMIKSLPNLESDVKERVRILSRLKSVEDKKELLNVKQLPGKLSVLEKIALFEGKAQLTKVEHNITRNKTTVTPRPVTRGYTESEYIERIKELKDARKYGLIEDMPTVTLRDGEEMPVLAVGTALLDPRLLKHIIGAAIDLGYRAIDTAYIYGNEREVGDAIRAKIEDGTVSRDELFIIGKLWSTFHRTDLVETACRASLDALGLQYFDLYMIHNPMSFKEGSDPLPKIATVLQYSQYDYLDAWYGIEKLVAKGLAKSIGVSNFNSVQIQRIMDKGKIKPSVNQVECHPYLSQQRLDQFCAERDIKLSCFGTLGSKGTPDEYKGSLTPVIDDALVKVMASGLNVSAAQLLIRYQLECERAVVVKSSSAAHLWDNLQALNLHLTSGQVEALHALNRNKRTFTFKGMGDTHRNYPFKISF